VRWTIAACPLLPLLPGGRHCLNRANTSCSPLSGSGVPQLETTHVYVSVYLDRLINGESNKLPSAEIAKLH
jgi:hypothetical protein